MNWSFRFKAALIHLAASLTVALIVAAVVFLLWYPGAYREMSGGTELFLLVVSVDVTLGPLISLVIFNSRKRRSELVRDVGVVVLLQLSALAYGMHTVSIARPVILALEVDRFRVVSAHDIYEPELAAAAPTLRRLSLTGPRLVRSPLPSDPHKKSDALVMGFKGYDIGARPSMWTLWDMAARNEALAHAKPLNVLKNRYRDRTAEFDAAIAKTRVPAAQLAYIPMITFRDDWIALLDRTGTVVGFAPFDGF